MNPDHNKQLLFDKESCSAEQTREYGKNFSAELKPGDIVCFYGNLGTGKTTFIQGLCSGLTVKETVNSPTFTLINEYHGDMPVYHFDFYRVNDTTELFELGLDEYFDSDGVCLIEWPEIIIEQITNSGYYSITLEHDFSKDGNTRFIKIEKNSHS